MNNPSWQEEYAEATDVLENERLMLIVWNDDINTFDWVIISLMEICDHTIEQAEQCAMTIHNTGKCDVKRGSYRELLPMKDALHDRGISASIE